MWTPPPTDPIPASIGDLERTEETDATFEGAGASAFGGMALSAGRDGPSHLFDIRDPDDVQLLSSFGDRSVRDVQFIAFPDCRLYAALVSQFDGSWVEVWDLTEPTRPSLAAEFQPPQGVHNVAVVPGTPILYNANSAGGGLGSQGPSGFGMTEIYDLSDPEDPKLVDEWPNGYGCHDITVHVDPGDDEYRAYCAGVETVQIWDVEVPTAPQVVHTMPYPHARDPAPATAQSPAAFAHLATVSDDGDTLIVGDENGGGLAPACDAHAEAAGRSASGPLGNLWFYDITNEEDPQLMGSFSPTSDYVGDARETTGLVDSVLSVLSVEFCTAHFGRVIAQQDRIAVGFYDAGVYMVDYSDPANPVPDAHWDVDESIWDVVPYRGHLFTGNRDAGLDVLEPVPG